MSINTVPFLQSSYLIDIYQRNSSNEFIFSNFFFFWTSLWYLYFAIFLSLLILIFLRLRFSSLIYTCLLLFYIIFIFIFFIEIHNTVTIDSFKSFFNFSLNKLLHNGTNKIHPFILYMSLVCFLDKFLSWSFYFNIVNKHTKNSIISHGFATYYRSLLLIITALFLGSWWALQEGSWGGWWNWDISEIFGLLIFYRILLILHTKLYWSSQYFNYWYGYVTTLLIVIFYLVMQINFELSAHDFGFKWLRFPTKEYAIYLGILAGLHILVLQIYKFYLYINMLNTFYINSIGIKIIFISLMISLIMYIHIILIGIDLYSIKILKEEKTIYSIDFSLIFLVLTILIISINLIHLNYRRFYLIFINWNSIFTIFLLCLTTPFRNTLQKILHFLVLLLVLYALHSWTLVTTHWISLVETCYKHQVLHISPDSNKLDLLYNFINRGTKTDIRTFKLSSNANQLLQEFLPTWQYKEINMLTTDYSPVTLVSICVLLIYIYISFLYKVIIF